MRGNGIEPFRNFRPTQLQTADFSEMICDRGTFVVTRTLADLAGPDITRASSPPTRLGCGPAAIRRTARPSGGAGAGYP